MTQRKPRIVILGAGFAGLAAAKRFAEEEVNVVLIDRHNHHVFQPLLYQVATAALSPAQIAQPVRAIMKKQANCHVVQSEVTGIDVKKKVVKGHKRQLDYDYLIVATGATHTYFNHPEWAPFAPGLKSIGDALHIRRLILAAFEQAEVTEDPKERAALMTFTLVGAGPTGVEMAGAIAELSRHTLADEFSLIKPQDARIILVEAGPRVLGAFPETLSRRAEEDLQRLGVEVMTGQPVTDCTRDGIVIGGTFIPCRTTIWSAGVKASPAAAWLGAEHDGAGRVVVTNGLHLPEHQEIFVIGDTAQVPGRDGKSVPGLAPAAEQQGTYAAEAILRQLQGKPGQMPFAYRDWGTMATIGRGKAVADVRGITFGGFFAWVLWGVIHLMPLVGFRNRFVVAMEWMWAYFTRSRGVRLITTDLTRDDG